MLKYQYHKAFLVCIFLVTSIIISHGQIKGSIKDKAGNILPYASVYIEVQVQVLSAMLQEITSWR